MSAIADAASVEAPPRRRVRATARPRRPVAGGVLWIVVVGVLLAGVVAVNVALLQLNVQRDQLGGERAQLRADNALLRSQLSSASSSLRVETRARTRLGLGPADPLLTTYVRLDAETK